MKLINTEAVIKVLRTKDNQKSRPNGTRRHDPFDEVLFGEEQFKIYHDTHLEWLSLNFRKYRATQTSSSIRRMILIMFEEDYQYFPSLREIRDGLIKA